MYAKLSKQPQNYTTMPILRRRRVGRKPHALGRALLGTFALAAAACNGDVDSVVYGRSNAETDPERFAPPDGPDEVVWYRGERRVARRHGDTLLIEGDIEVGPSDIWGGPDDIDFDGTTGEIGRLRQAVRIQGANFRWPGAIPFVFGATNNLAAGGNLAGAFSAGQRTAIHDALDDWEDAVPGLSFVARGTQADFITFNLSTVCSSPVGRQSGSQTIRVTVGCINSFSLHHEIAHSLGVFHQHTRKDRDDFVTVNWGSIRGCNNTATGPTLAAGCGGCTTAATAADCGCTAAQVIAGTCDSFHNFVTNGNRSDIGKYDYDSVMHYGSFGFSWGGNPSITAARAIGQRTRLSAGDCATVQAMYPVLRTQATFFQDTGNRALCRLQGREGDRFATKFTTTGDVPPANVSDGVLDTDLGTGDYRVSCSADSTFWARNYNYPNTTVPFSAVDGVEEYAETATVRVLSRGLITLLF